MDLRHRVDFAVANGAIHAGGDVAFVGKANMPR